MAGRRDDIKAPGLFYAKEVPVPIRFKNTEPPMLDMWERAFRTLSLNDADRRSFYFSVTHGGEFPALLPQSRENSRIVLCCCKRARLK